MVHLAEEILSELLDGGHAAGAEAHLATCRVCRDELEAMRRLSAEYDAALQNLERLTQRQGGATPSLAEERLASLNTLVEASRAALSAEPTDPVLNTYLFTALEQRDQVMRELRGRATSGSEVLWR